MRASSFFAVTALLLVAAPARAQSGQGREAPKGNEVALRINNGFYPGSGLDLVSTNDHLVGMELGYARELLSLRRGSLWAEGSYLLTGSSAKSFDGRLDSKAQFHTLTVGAVYRLPLYRWLVPHARVGVGLLVGRLGVTPSGGAEIVDRSVAFAGHALVGAELLWPRARLRQGSFNFGLVIEGGYSFASPLGFTLTPSRPDDLRAIPVSGASLGSLVLHGGQLRVGALVRF
jgi:hypothetical protein